MNDDQPESAREPRRGPSIPAFVVLVVAAMFAAGAATYWWDHRPTQINAVDVGFFDDMPTHHMQAIAIGNTYLRYGTDPLFHGDAAKVVFSQAGDIRQMQRALSEWKREGSPDVAMEWMSMRVPQDANREWRHPNR